MLGTMFPVLAQNKITGKVVDEKGEALAFANVILLNRQDSAFVTGTTSGEDGCFTIESSCENGIVKVTSVGYKTICKNCTGDNLGIISMNEDSKMLGEVVVKSTLPKTVLRNGGDDNDCCWLSIGESWNNGKLARSNTECNGS